MKIDRFVVLFVLVFLLSACAGRQAAVKSTAPAPAATPAPAAKVEPPAAAPEKALPAAEKAPAPAAKPAAPATVKSGGEKLLIVGQVEYITILPAKLRLAARVDTGATTSSIHAVNIKRFERDGKKWVRFYLVGSGGKKVKMERPVVRTIEVKRHGTSQQSRPVVTLRVAMGPIKTTTQFSLTNRSQFKYPVLIGRSLLNGVAVVDVNREYVLSPLAGGDDEK